MATDNYFSDLTLALPGTSGSPFSATVVAETEPISTRSSEGIFTGVSSLFNGIATGIGTAAQAVAPLAAQVIAAKLVEPTAAQQQAALTAQAAAQGASGTVNRTTTLQSAKADGQWLAGVSNTTVVLTVVGILAVSIFAGAMAQRGR